MIDETLTNLRTLGCRIVVANDPEGRGVGWAMREGLKEVETEWVVFAMADGSEDLESLGRMIDLTDDTRLSGVWGDRWVRGSVTGYPPVKRWANRIANHLIQWMMHGHFYTDWTDPAKAYRTQFLRRIHWSDDFRSAVEMPVRYLRLFPAGISFRIVPMHWRQRTAGQSAYKFSHALGCLRALWTVMIYG